jgi:hypothetical protein
MLLLPSSLKKLSFSFGVEKKSLFPILFVNNNKVELDYEGTVPLMQDFVDINLEDYNEYFKSFLNKN